MRDHVTLVAVAGGRLRSLDGLRGLAAVTVVVNHSLAGWGDRPWWLYLPPVMLFWGGSQAVALFFVLSGFVLALPFTEDLQPRPWRFATKRWIRLYPTYLFVVLASAGLAAALHGAVPRLGSPGAVVAEYWSMLVTVRHDILDDPTWSLVYEARISLLFPLLAAWLIRPTQPWRRFVICFTAGLVMAGSGNPVGQTLFYLPLFAAGIILARYRHEVVDWYRSLSLHGRAAFVVVSLLVYANPLPVERIHLALYGTGLTMDLAQGPTEYLVMAGSCGLIVTALASGAAASVLTSRTAALLGRVSYSMYLVHALILFPVIYLLAPRAPMLLLVAATWPAILGASLLVHRYIEAPSITLSHMVARRARRDLPVAEATVAQPAIASVRRD